MEPPFFGGGSGANPAEEALRWLAIGEKLLTARDFMGSKSFATRAREADPQLIAAYQILAVVDTLMAAEKRINGQLNWYLILQIQPTHDHEAIATQYRRLAILLNPQKNQLPFADQAFRLVVEAWAVLSNVSRKRVYDAEVSLHSLQQGSVSVNANANVGVGVNVSPVVTLDLTGQSLFGQSQSSNPPPQGGGFQFQINSGNSGNDRGNVSGSTMMFGFGEEGRRGVVMGGVGGGGGGGGILNMRGSREGDGVGGGGGGGGNGGGYMGNNVWVSRDDGRGGGAGNGGGDANEDVGVQASGNAVMDEVVVEDVGEENEGEEEVLGEGDGLGGGEPVNDVEGNFWTACPYCYHMFEYPRVYADCTLRCQKCRKAFHGVEVASPPPIVEGEEAYFCCWGYMPLAVSVNDLGNSGGRASNWTPFSPMFTCPQKPGGGPKSYSAPRFYHDDDDVYVDVAESSDGSDDDWRTSERKKKAKNTNGKRATASAAGTTKKNQNEKAKNVSSGIAETTQHGSVIQGIVGGAVSVNGPASNTRRQSGRVANGKLDLNVEFSNETEEQVSRTRLANGAVHGNIDNFEGTGFFEGLDEFLSSLPIITGVPDDRVKAA